MTGASRVLLHLIGLVVLPFVVVGVVNRTKSLWAGRKGPPILQLAYDVARLLRKRAVYSETTSFVFRRGPWVVLAASLISGFVAPFLALRSPLSFPFDFVWFAYAWGLGRIALMLGALDTGSSFEGMGASREATFAALVEPAFFLVAGAACLVSHEHSFAAILSLRANSGAPVVWFGSVVALFILVQVECARMPVDDPTTHLELTMVHEVMVLDHSGPDLAALQTAGAAKLTIGLGIIATLLNPLADQRSATAATLVNVALILLLAIFMGTIESLVARLQLRAVPQFIVVALLAGSLALLATTWGPAGGG